MFTDVSNEFINVHSASGRTFRALLYDNKSEIISSDITSLKTSSGDSACEDISVGKVFSSVVNMEMQYSDAIAQKLINGTKVMLYLGLQLSDGSFEDIPVNTDFKVISGVRNGEKFAVTVADKLYDSDILFTCVTSSPTAEDIVREICNDLGIAEYDADGCNLSSLKISAIPENATCRKMLGYIASYFGKNVYIGRDGKLLFRWYDFNSSQELDDDSIETPEIGDSVSVGALSCFVDSEKTLSSGSGRAQSFENPYMTQTQLNAIKPLLCKSYNIAVIKHLVGSILTDAWDTIRYKDYIIPVMGCDISFDGGVTSTYTATGRTNEDAAAVRTPPTEVLIAQAKKYADAAAEKATELIRGANGGYYIEKTDANGKPYETLWMDADNETSAKHCICINKNGMGFGEKNSKNKWVFKQAWTIDGTFVTDFITANELSITGKLTNKKNGTAVGTKMDMHFEVSAEMSLPFLNKTVNAAGLRAWSDKDNATNEALYTNWGVFFDSLNEDDSLHTLLTSILASANGLNFYGVRGFYLTGKPDENGNTPVLGALLDSGFWSNNAFNTEDGFYVNSIPCVTEWTGVNNRIHDGYMEDCNSPWTDVTSSSEEDQLVCIEVFNKNTLNLPFEGSVGYIITLNYFSTTSRYTIQFGIRYRDNQIKMRSYNKINSNADGTNSAWSDWSEPFVTSDVTNRLSSEIADVRDSFSASFDSSAVAGCEKSLSGCITQWGTIMVSASGTTVTLPQTYKNKNYGISLTPMGANRNVWYSVPTVNSFKIWASVDDTPVNWMTIGI